MGRRAKDTKAMVRKFLSTNRPTGHGPSHEANHGWADPKPYSQVYSNGMFEGYDGSLWVYYGFPQDVRISWTREPEEIIENQSFLNDIFDELGKKMDNQIERTRGDLRRDFHIVLTQDKYPGIQPYPGCTPAHADYLRRSSEEIVKPEWFGYMGFKLMESDALHDSYGISNKIKQYLEYMRDPDLIKMALFKEDIEFLDNLMTMPGIGFRPLDFTGTSRITGRSGQVDFEKLTAWHGIEDERFGVRRQLENTRFAVPVHGNSVILQKEWGEGARSSSEVSFHAVRPREGTFLVDPQSNFAQWGSKLFTPGLDVVSVSVRGQVRSSRVADNLLEMKRDNRSRRADKMVSGATSRSSNSMDNKVIEEVSKLDVARQMVGSGHTPLLDNVEIVVGSLVTEKPMELNKYLNDHNLESVPLIGRQPDALCSTFPTYPHHVMRVKNGSATRSIMTNSVLPGILSFSGLMRSTKPAEPHGIFLGLSDIGHEYKEIYTAVDSPNRHNGIPGFLVSGAPGAGKTQLMLQFAEQTVYQGHSCFFLNPKPDAPLGAVFDHLGGVTVSMSSRYLDDNPGLYDPVFYFDALVPRDDNEIDMDKQIRVNRGKVADILADAIFTAIKWKYQRENVAAMTSRMSAITTQIRINAADLRNECSYDILFGNERKGTKAIDDQEILDFVATKIQNSPFWKAFISQTNQSSSLLQRMMENKAVLVEWDGSLKLPKAASRPENYSPAEIDSLLSVQITFIYASAILGQGRAGGALIADESWVFKGNEEIKAILDSGFREWRQANITLMLGTQRIADWMDGQGSEDDMTTFFGRIMMMKITENDERELDLFYKFSGLKRSRYYTNYIMNAGTSKDRPGQPPRGFYIDNLTKWRGPIITGPYPELELSLGRTDKEGEQARKLKETGGTQSGGTVYGGALGLLVDDDLREDNPNRFIDNVDAVTGNLDEETEGSMDWVTEDDKTPSRQVESPTWDFDRI